MRVILKKTMSEWVESILNNSVNMGFFDDDYLQQMRLSEDHHRDLRTPLPFSTASISISHFLYHICANLSYQNTGTTCSPVHIYFALLHFRLQHIFPDSSPEA